MSPPRPHLFARSSFAEASDRLIRHVWTRGWDEKPPLEPDYLWQVGSEGFTQEDEVSIRSEEEVADFRLRLERLCAALNEEADLNALGHTMAYGQLRNAVRKRHALGRLWRENPALAETDIAPPIIVLGQMRSGTTRVQRLLAADPQFSGTRFCDSHDPVPAKPDLRPIKASAALFMARKVNPWLDTFHPFGATRTDEEIGWLSAALSPAAFEAQWRIPSYISFNESRDPTPVYAEFARMLRTDSAANGTFDRPRVLKCPQFAEDAEAVLQAFPDACVIVCKRSAEKVHQSAVSMVASQMAFQSDSHCRDHLGVEWERKMALRDQRLESALAGFTGPVAHVDFDVLNADPLAAMAEVYRDLGLIFDDRSAKAITNEAASAEGSSHHGHRHQIEHLLKQRAGNSAV